jgi:Trypsin-like peptidase domain
MIDTLLLATARISTFEHERGLTNATGFYFERDGRLFLVTSRHVVIDEATQHHPNRIEIELHTDAANLGQSTGLSMLLFQQGKALWRQGRDNAGEIDVAVIEIERSALPAGTLLHAFTPAHLPTPASTPEARGGIAVGSRLLVVGFPLGFHDTLHHLPVVRQAILATAWGLRFQGEGFFLTDARTHRGTSGAPVVMPDPEASTDNPLPWKLLGVHSGRLDMSTRDKVLDESLGLNMAWYADILLTLTATQPAEDVTAPPAG